MKTLIQSLLIYLLIYYTTEDFDLFYTIYKYLYIFRILPVNNSKYPVKIQVGGAKPFLFI